MAARVTCEVLFEQRCAPTRQGRLASALRRALPEVAPCLGADVGCRDAGCGLPSLTLSSRKRMRRMRLLPGSFASPERLAPGAPPSRLEYLIHCLGNGWRALIVLRMRNKARRGRQEALVERRGGWLGPIRAKDVRAWSLVVGMAELGKGVRPGELRQGVCSSRDRRVKGEPRGGGPRTHGSKLGSRRSVGGQARRSGAIRRRITRDGWRRSMHAEPRPEVAVRGRRSQAPLPGHGEAVAICVLRGRSGTRACGKRQRGGTRRQ